ncbi:1,4-alpha-glucan branching protein GlgB [Bacillus sp. FJAT-27445]|uniref:1,4-alpha-glucan branching protein GlgB n=1 Tax=Bacillus sp. FJAT-27445 TaxID=1679166 RepID=UPI0007444D0E|nr:1,4-alpha-glucan branching protein GlgB [Bacillus sp. FJAT-27445]
MVNHHHPTEFQLHLFHEGALFKSHELFGAHVINEGGQTYTRFCVWAPHASEVRLAGDFNGWNGEGYIFDKVNKEGVWVLFIERDMTGSLYKYEIIVPTGEKKLKSDPFAYYSEVRPNTASIVQPLDGYKWNDQAWMRKRSKKVPQEEATAIYEVHLGSWKKADEDGSFLTYRQAADELVPYVVEHGYTHIELLPLTEHPLDASWGYQTTGYFSITSRYGTPQDFMYFVDRCHQNGIGVILDWVPGHFCKDAHGLYSFDGDYAYEYKTLNDRENSVWGTANFDLGKTEVISFLVSNAIFWLEKYHIDGFRVDAVANIIYWPNSEKEVNPHGIAFLKKLNSTVSSFCPNILMIAEDSTDWPNVTKSPENGGLGFTYKWNMGWMNDILKYMETDPNQRRYHHNKVTFSLMYAFTENFVLPFSHDEVVHGKKSLLDKMPGDYWQKFAQLRLLLGYQIGHPGKKLTFMGTELGQFSEWKDKEEIDWHLQEYEMHAKLNLFVKELNKIYKRSKPLYQLDSSPEGFDWIDADNNQQSVFSFVRRGFNDDDFLIIVCNFTWQAYSGYRVGVPAPERYREILNSDALEFGGSGVINKKTIKAEKEGFHSKPFSITMNIPPYGISILRPVKKRKGINANAKEEDGGHASGRRTGEQAKFTDKRTG